MPEVSRTLIPVHTFAVVTKPLGEKLATAIEYPGAISDTDFRSMITQVRIIRAKCHALRKKLLPAAGSRNAGTR